MDISQHFLPTQIPAFFRRAGYARGMVLFKEDRVRNLRNTTEGAQALIYDLEGTPYRAEISYTSEGFGWVCECSSLRPCAHAAALLLELYSQDRLPREWDFPSLETLAENQDETGEIDSGSAVPNESTPQMSLFSDDLFSVIGTSGYRSPSPVRNRRSPVPRSEAEPLPGLFDAPVPEPRQSAKPLPPDARHLGFCLVPDSKGLVLEPVLLGRNPEEDGFYPYREGILTRRLPEAVEIILDLLVKAEVQGRRVGVHDLIRLLDTLELAEEDHYRGLRLPLHWPGNSIPAKVVKVAHLTVRLIRDDGDDTVYIPMLLWTFDHGARPLTQRGDLDFWDEDGQFYWYQADRNWLVYGESWYREIRFLRSFFGSDVRVFSREQTLEIEAALEGIGGIDLEFSGEDEGIICPMPRIVASLQGNSRGTEVYLSFRYRSWEPSYQEKALRYQVSSPGEKLLIIQRNLDGEASLVHDLVRTLGDLVVYERGYYAAAVTGNREADLQIRFPINDFLHARASELMALGVEIRVEKRKVRIAKELRFAVQQNMDWFGIKAEVEVEETDRSMIPGTGQATEDQISIDEGLKSYGMVVRAHEYVLLGPKDLRRLEYLRRQGMTEDGALQSSAANLVLIDAIYENARAAEDGIEIDWSSRRQALEVLQDHERLPRVLVPQGLQAQLRAYQHKGLDWLVYMHEHNLNPCLADDMGLGKTLQTIALLLFMRERGVTGPFLLIAPVVTLGNWEAEVERFAPGMKVLRHSGSDRTQDVDRFARADLVLVSYHTLRNDVDLFLDQEFTYIILDEAHSIKNHYSQVFKAVRSLRSLHRLSLTGTPIENTLMELWSQMNFLNPGLLGTAKEFYNRYFLPIEKQGDQNVLDELKDLVGPFILRRTKDQVLDDLPAKEVIVHYCEMDEIQAGYYTQQRDQFRDQILGIFQNPEEETETGDENDGAPKKPTHRGKATIEIFRFLLKLRQLAIHPPIAGPEYHRVPSAKMEGLLLLLEEILTENHKVLIFSQFLGSLEAIAQECRRRSWAFSLLTGATQDRTTEIERFQDDEDTRVFLLSLKAGGVGINLTAADYVILFDPWWNPAAEKQAIDRAHRIGQKKNVIAYKLIVRGTIEEKILQLQERKHALAEEIITEGRGILASLPRDEVVNLFQ